MMNSPWPIFALILILLSVSPAFSWWEVQHSGVNVTLRDVSFVDSLHGWSVGDNATIIATTDGGKNWNLQNSPVEGVRLRKVWFVNQDVGYVVGDGGTILTTRTGGDAWKRSESGVIYTLYDLSFINSDTGWVAGGSAGGLDEGGVLCGGILHTRDGGQTWQKQVERVSSSPSSGIPLFRAIRFFDSENGWAFANPSNCIDFCPSEAYRTSDGGRHWNFLGNVYSTYIFWDSYWGEEMRAEPGVEVGVSEVSMLSPDVLWVCGRAWFAKSTDGGVNWETRLSFGLDIRSVFDVVQLSEQAGWLLVYSSKEQESRMLFTDDGGTTWMTILIVRQSDIPSLPLSMAISGRHLWAVGNSGLVIHYVISYKADQTTSAEQSRDPFPQEFHLKQNFPNPFNAATTIRFSIEARQYVTLAVYDITGRKIVSLFSQPVNPGTYSITWDGRDAKKRRVSSGIYLYELRSAGCAAKKKMVLIH